MLIMKEQLKLFWLILKPGFVDCGRVAHEQGATIAIVNIGTTRADNFVPFKIKARCGEVCILLFLSSSLLFIFYFLFL